MFNCNYLFHEHRTTDVAELAKLLNGKREFLYL